MRRLFSYKRDRFLTGLLLSVAGHLLVIAAGYLAPQPAVHSVQHGRSSVELTLVSEMSLREQPPGTQEEILTTEQEAEEVPEVSRPTPEEVQKEADEIVPDEESLVDELIEEELEEKPEEVASPPEQGALAEPKPVEYINPAPGYPRLARLRGWEGLVLLRVFVTSDGRVKRVEIEESSGRRILDMEAFNTVSRWQFEPARRGALRLAGEVVVPVRFKLQD